MAGARSADLPSGFRYIPDFLSDSDERELIRFVRTLTFNEVRMHGVAAKRRTAHFGRVYGYETWDIMPGPPIPDALLPLRERAAGLVGVAAELFEEILITDYPPGAGIGWHRDAPMFGPAVVGVSLLSPARFRFQRRMAQERQIAESLLEPRSAYVLTGEARSSWQHSIPAGKQQRYSITFRTLRTAGNSLMTEGISIPTGRSGR
ncbi:alpha-ketoglutarate-dependent dioxygenase AlkB [Nitrospira sp. Nam80]